MLYCFLNRKKLPEERTVQRILRPMLQKLTGSENEVDRVLDGTRLFFHPTPTELIRVVNDTVSRFGPFVRNWIEYRRTSERYVRLDAELAEIGQAMVAELLRVPEPIAALHLEQAGFYVPWGTLHTFVTDHDCGDLFEQLSDGGVLLVWGPLATQREIKKLRKERVDEFKRWFREGVKPARRAV